MLTLVGQYIGSELSAPIKTKSGETYRIKTIAIKSPDSLQNLLVEVPENFEVEGEVGDEVELNVKASSKHWDNTQRKFVYSPVKFYIPKDTQ